MISGFRLLIMVGIVFCLFFSGCSSLDAESELTEEEQALVDDAVNVAQEMFSQRQTSELSSHDHEQLKSLYTVVTFKQPKGVTLFVTYYTENHMNDLHEKTGSLSNITLLKSKVGEYTIQDEQSIPGHHVRLEYEVEGENGTNKETLGLWKVHSEYENASLVDSWNMNEFRIISHR